MGHLPPPGRSRTVKLAQVYERLVCPECHRPLSESCGHEVRREANGSVWFGQFSPGEPSTDPLNKIKETVKSRAPWLFTRLVPAISPVYFPGIPKVFLSRFDYDRQLVIDVGSGCFRLHPGFTTVDGGNYAEVDLRCNAEKLPFADNSVDGVVTIALLEHVPRPQVIVDEIFRVLKPGGSVYCCIPFMQGIHASPDDFWRFTPHGLEVLFARFKTEPVTTELGPSSAMVWMMQSYLAMLFSFGNKRLFWVWYSFFFCLSPLKFLDIFLRKHPMASTIASGYGIIGTKASSQ
jgi:hypothetical protein